MRPESSEIIGPSNMRLVSLDIFAHVSTYLYNFNQSPEDKMATLVARLNVALEPPGTGLGTKKQSARLCDSGVKLNFQTALFERNREGALALVSSIWSRAPFFIVTYLCRFSLDQRRFQINSSEFVPGHFQRSA